MFKETAFTAKVKKRRRQRHRRRQRIKGGRGTTVSDNTSQLIAEQSLNPPKEQTITSDSLTMRAIQAFMDTEDEWAQVYTNLAKS